MRIIYYSLTGNCRRFAEQLSKSVSPMSDFKYEPLTEPAVLVFSTMTFGKVPPRVWSFVKENKSFIKLVVASGNKNWGDDFAKGADDITHKTGIPSCKIEQEPTVEDIKMVKDYIKRLP